MQTTDPFLRRKYNQYLSKNIIGEKPESFYDRMEKDRKRREELLKQTMQENAVAGRNSQMSRQSKMNETSSSAFSPNNKGSQKQLISKKTDKNQLLDSIKETPAIDSY